MSKHSNNTRIKRLFFSFTIVQCGNKEKTRIKTQHCGTKRKQNVYCEFQYAGRYERFAVAERHGTTKYAFDKWMIGF